MIRPLGSFLRISSFLPSIARRALTLSPTVAAKKDEKPPVEEPKEEQYIVVEKDGPVTMIGMNRPTKRNAINAVAAQQLMDAFEEFEEDETSSVGVLYGMGGNFSSGYDINELSLENVEATMLMNGEGCVGPTRGHLKKPVVCGINGYCVANGLELALMCDLRVMEEGAILGFFNRRFGVPIIDGGTARLPAMIGLSRALDLILTGRQVTAKEAFNYGIANRIVATGTALGQSVHLAHSIAKFPQGALNHDRNSVYSAVYDSPNFNQSMQNEIMYTSKQVIEEMKQGVELFQSGIGRHGKSKGIREKSMADWEIEEVRFEKEHQAKMEAEEAERVDKTVEGSNQPAKETDEESKESTKPSAPDRTEPKVKE